MSFKAIIFDCDGVLIDSEIVVCRIAAEELTRVGYPISTEDVIRRFAGRPDREMRAEIESEMGRALPDDYRKRVNERTIEAYATELQPMPGVQEALDKVSLPTCVASSSFPEKLKLGLQTVGLYEGFMPNVVSASMVLRGKPEPDVFIFAAGWMKVSPRDCLIIEDSVAGVTAGKQSGATVLGFTGGAHCDPGHAQRLKDAGAREIFSAMKNLPDLIARIQQPSA